MIRISFLGERSATMKKKQNYQNALRRDATVDWMQNPRLLILLVAESGGVEAQLIGSRRRRKQQLITFLSSRVPETMAMMCRREEMSSNKTVGGN